MVEERRRPPLRTGAFWVLHQLPTLLKLVPQGTLGFVRFLTGASILPDPGRDGQSQSGGGGAEAEGFEPSEIRLGTSPNSQLGAIGHSATPPPMIVLHERWTTQSLEQIALRPLNCLR